MLGVVVYTVASRSNRLHPNLQVGYGVIMEARAPAICARILALGSLCFFVSFPMLGVVVYTVVSGSNRLHPNLQVGYGGIMSARVARIYPR